MPLKLSNLTQEKLLSILRLHKSKAIGNILAKKLIAAVGDIEQLFLEKPATLHKIHGIGNHVTKHLFDKQNISLAEQELAFIEDNHYEVDYFLDASFPKNLLHCIDGPFVLFKDGNINQTNDKILSVVGTRNMSTYGKFFCEQLIDELSVYNPIIVSGFAYGVDICAHKAAIKNNLQTIAVLAHGFEKIYPKAHKKYMRQVMDNGGFYTEFGYEESPYRENFLKRNRIVAGMSQATIIIESAEKGGSLVTADIANSYDREVFALPGKISDIYSKGCNNLIKRNQASLLTSSNDIIKMLNWDLVAKPKKTVQKALFITLSEQEQTIYDYLKENGKQLLDLISIDCDIPLFQLSAILLQMELKGITKPLPGKMFALA